MKIEYEIQELNRRIDETYDEYVKNLTELRNKKNALAQHCNSTINVIDSERHLMRIEIEKMYRFLLKFGTIGEQVTIFEYKTEGRVPLDFDEPRTKIDKVIFDEKHWFLDGAIRAGIAKKKNRDHISEKEAELLLEQTEQANHLQRVTDSTMMIELIDKIVELYRVSVTMVKDAVSKICPEFCLVEAFLMADRMKDNIINGDNPSDVDIENYQIDMYENTPYGKYFLFVRNVFDYYQFITKVYTECILGKIIEDSIVTDEERDMFEAQMLEVERRSQQLVGMIEAEV